MKKLNQFKSAKNMGLLRSLWSNRTHFFTMLREVIDGKYKFSLLTLLAIVGSLLYIISPIDLVPDFIPVAGWLDDGAIFYLLLKRLMNETENWLVKRESNPKVVVLN